MNRVTQRSRHRRRRRRLEEHLIEYVPVLQQATERLDAAAAVLKNRRRRSVRPLPVHPMLESTPLDAAGQRRHLTLLFMDLCASSRLAERLEAEQFAAVLATLRRVCHDAVERQRGRVVRVQGDGVLAIFGLPVPAEDDCFRAASAALEAQEEIDREHRMSLPG